MAGFAVVRAELNFAEKDISRRRGGAFKKNLLGCVWRSSARFSIGEKHGPVKGLCWEGLS